MKPKVYRRPKIGAHSYLGNKFSGKSGRFGSKLYKGMKKGNEHSLLDAFQKIEEEQQHLTSKIEGVY